MGWTKKTLRVGCGWSCRRGRRDRRGRNKAVEGDDDEEVDT